MPNKYTVIRGLIMKQTEPFCLLDLFLRLAKEGIDNREAILYVLDDLYDNGLVEHVPIETKNGVTWAFKVAS